MVIETKRELLIDATKSPTVPFLIDKTSVKYKTMVINNGLYVSFVLPIAMRNNLGIEPTKETHTVIELNTKIDREY